MSNQTQIYGKIQFKMLYNIVSFTSLLHDILFFCQSTSYYMILFFFCQSTSTNFLYRFTVPFQLPDNLLDYHYFNWNLIKLIYGILWELHERSKLSDRMSLSLRK